MALTKKQKTFVEEYLIDLNATQAAIRSGYSPSTANEQGARLLANVSVKASLEKALAERSKRTGINQDLVIRELCRIARVNIMDVLDENCEIRPNATEDDLACIESMKVKTSDNQFGSSTEREVKVASKLKALELLGKHLGMWNDKLNVNLNLPVFYEGEDDLEE